MRTDTRTARWGNYGSKRRWVRQTAGAQPTVGAVGGLGRLLPAPLGLPKGFLEVQVRREADPGECGGIPRTAGALDPSLHLQENQFLPLTWKNRDLMELGTNSDSAGCSKGIPATHTHSPGKAPAKSRRCRARFGAPGNGSASSTARGGRALGTRLDGGWQHSLLPPDPL